MTFTIKEGQALAKAVRDNSAVLAVGSQQRSETNFQYAVSMVKKDHIGKIHKVQVNVVGQPESAKAYDFPSESLFGQPKLFLQSREYFDYTSLFYQF